VLHAAQRCPLEEARVQRTVPPSQAGQSKVPVLPRNFLSWEFPGMAAMIKTMRWRLVAAQTFQASCSSDVYSRRLVHDLPSVDRNERGIQTLADPGALRSIPFAQQGPGTPPKTALSSSL
jgi:hypothetical protein